MSTLNPAQKEAAQTIDKHVRIVAGAGSGKTRVLMARIEYLLNEIGVYPDRILAITFTNKAAREMKNRLAAQCPDMAKDVKISTIHALCARILREDATALGYPKDFAILDPEDQKSMLRDAYRQLGVDKYEFPVGRTIGYISDQKTNRVDPEKAKKMAWSQHFDTLAELYENYENQRKEMKAMDFDDLLLETDTLLKEHEDVRNKWQKRLDYIHVDEFQDVDPVQYDIIKNLVRDDAILCVVGDPDQTIYTWRGASVGIILNFDKDFENSKTVILDENYRSTKPILDASNAVVHHNKDRIEKNLYTNKEGDDLLVLHGEDRETDEAQYVARQINDLHKQGVPYEDMAILYRANYCSRPFEKTLRLINVPYQMYGGTRFYERMEVKDILSYLRLLTEPDPANPASKAVDLAVERVINQPKRGIGTRTVEKLKDKAREEDTNMLEIMKDTSFLSAGTAKKINDFYEVIEDLKEEKKRLSLPDLIDVILDYTGYTSMVKEKNEEERLENIEELKNDIRQSFKDNPNLTLEEYLQNVSLFSDPTEPADPVGVNLMTVHASKGTEFPVVFITAMNEGVFPNQRSLEEARENMGTETKAMEEERRLLYVAMTRAKKRLFLTWNLDYNYNTSTNKEKSRFLQEIPPELVQGNRPPKHTFASEAQAAKSAFGRAPVSSRNRKAASRRPHFKKGDIVDHKVYGEGVIVSMEGDNANIAFGHPIGVKKINSKHPSLTLKKGRS